VVRVGVLFGIVVADGVVASLLRRPRMRLPLQMVVLNLAGRDDDFARPLYTEMNFSLFLCY
jgi:hypothetical protein